MTLRVGPQSGRDPFDHIGLRDGESKLASLVKCYNPTGQDSKERYAWIRTHLANAVEEAIQIRNAN